jgi:hypothetical protein
MEREDPTPEQAIRSRAADAIGKLDLTSEDGQAAAHGVLELTGEADEKQARRREALASIARQWVALLGLALLAILCTGAVLWILFRSGSPIGVQIGSLSAVISGFGAVVVTSLRRSGRPGASEQDDDAARQSSELEPDDSRIAILQWLRRLRR